MYQKAEGFLNANDQEKRDHFFVARGSSLKRVMLVCGFKQWRGYPLTTRRCWMEKQDVVNIAEGLRLIEMGVEKIQSVMREKKIKSLKDMAAELIPFFKEDDHELTDRVINRLEK